MCSYQIKFCWLINKFLCAQVLWKVTLIAFDFADGIEYCLRYPTYNTAGILQDENHQAAVIAVQPIIAPGDR